MKDYSNIVLHIQNTVSNYSIQASEAISIPMQVGPPINVPIGQKAAAAHDKSFANETNRFVSLLHAPPTIFSIASNSIFFIFINLNVYTLSNTMGLMFSGFFACLTAGFPVFYF